MNWNDFVHCMSIEDLNKVCNCISFFVNNEPLNGEVLVRLVEIYNDLHYEMIKKNTQENMRYDRYEE